MGKTRESNNEMHQKVENSATGHIREPSCSNSCNVCRLLSFLPYEKASFSNWFISDDGETHSRRPRFPEVDEASGTEGIDADEAEEDDFDEEEEGEDSASGGFLEGGEDLDSVVSVGREEVGADCELIPIMREESSITDSVSPIS
jgi:hypothetical protein